MKTNRTGKAYRPGPMHKQARLALVSTAFAAGVMVITVLVHYTGGIDSAFILLYPLCILAASAVGAGGVFSQSIAGGSALLFGLLVLLEYAGALDTFGGMYSSYSQGPWLVAFLFFFRIFIFGLVDMIGTVLMNRLSYEQSKRRSLEDFKTQVLERMSHGIITAGAQDRIIYANERALEILGCGLQDLVGKNWRGFFEESALCDSGAQPLSSGMSQDGRNEMHLAICCPDGSEKILSLDFSHQVDETGRVVNKLILFRDVTGVRRMEKKLKASEKWALLGEVAAGIVHEIRNPLSSIRGSIEVLRSRRAFEKNDAELLNVILQESDRLNQILEDYLTYSRKGPSQPGLCDLGLIVEQLLRVLQGHPRLRKDVRLHWKPNPRSEQVVVDDQQIRQLLLNIIQNALDAMPGGGDLTLRLEYSRTEETPGESDTKIASLGHWARLDIEDTGTGMPQEVMDRLYEPFFSTKKEGHGIGLALCRSIVESHKGFLRVKSEPGKGTTFSIYFPVAGENIRAHERRG